MLFFTSDGELKRKNSRTAAPFWPQRDLSVVGSRVDASGQRSIEWNLTQCFFSGESHWRQCLREKKERYWRTVAPENEEHPGRENWVHYAQKLVSIQFLIAYWLASRWVFCWIKYQNICWIKYQNIGGDDIRRNGGLTEWWNGMVEYKEYSRMRNMQYTLKRRIREKSF